MDDPKSPNDTYVNPDAWNNRVSRANYDECGNSWIQANVFFLDQPIGTGFSHGENGQACLYDVSLHH